MKRFHFRLERLARLAEAERRLRGSELAEARRLQAEAEADVAREREALARATDEWWRRAGRGERVEVLAASAAWREVTARAVGEKEAVALERASVVAARREDWLEARRRTEMFERLEERQRERHSAEVRRTEQATIDEAAAGRLKGGEQRWH